MALDEQGNLLEGIDNISRDPDVVFDVDAVLCRCVFRVQRVQYPPRRRVVHHTILGGRSLLTAS